MLLSMLVSTFLWYCSLTNLHSSFNWLIIHSGYTLISINSLSMHLSSSSNSSLVEKILYALVKLSEEHYVSNFYVQTNHSRDKLNCWYFFYRSLFPRCHSFWSVKHLKTNFVIYLQLVRKLKRIKREFIEINEYPEWTVKQLKVECKLVNENPIETLKLTSTTTL